MNVLLGNKVRNAYRKCRRKLVFVLFVFTQRLDGIFGGVSTVQRDQDNYGNYNFGYNIEEPFSQQFQVETGDAFGRKEGAYGFTDPDGRRRLVQYVADEHGFRAHVKTNEPGTSTHESGGAAVEKDPEVVVATAPVAVAPAVPLVPELSVQSVSPFAIPIRNDYKLLGLESPLAPSGTVRMYSRTAVPAYRPGLETALPAYRPGLETALPAYRPGLETALPAYKPGLETALPAYRPGLEAALPAYRPSLEAALPAYRPSLETALPAYKARLDTPIPAYRTRLETPPPGTLAPPFELPIRDEYKHLGFQMPLLPTGAVKMYAGEPQQSYGLILNQLRGNLDRSSLRNIPYAPQGEIPPFVNPYQVQGVTRGAALIPKEINGKLTHQLALIRSDGSLSIAGEAQNEGRPPFITPAAAPPQGYPLPATPNQVPIAAQGFPFPTGNVLSSSNPTYSGNLNVFAPGRINPGDSFNPALANSGLLFPQGQYSRTVSNSNPYLFSQGQFRGPDERQNAFSPVSFGRTPIGTEYERLSLAGLTPYGQLQGSALGQGNYFQFPTSDAQVSRLEVPVTQQGPIPSGPIHSFSSNPTQSFAGFPFPDSFGRSFQAALSNAAPAASEFQSDGSNVQYASDSGESQSQLQTTENTFHPSTVSLPGGFHIKTGVSSSAGLPAQRH